MKHTVAAEFQTNTKKHKGATVVYIGFSLEIIINIDPLLHILTSVLKQQQQQQVHKEMLRSLSDDLNAVGYLYY